MLTIAADVGGDVAAQTTVAAAVRDNFGALDAAFLNAGIGDFRPLEKWDEAGFGRSVAVNLKGPGKGRMPAAFSRTIPMTG